MVYGIILYSYWSFFYNSGSSNILLQSTQHNSSQLSKGRSCWIHMIREHIKRYACPYIRIMKELIIQTVIARCAYVSTPYCCIHHSKRRMIFSIPHSSYLKVQLNYKPIKQDTRKVNSNYNSSLVISIFVHLIILRHTPCKLSSFSPPS